MKQSGLKACIEVLLVTLMSAAPATAATWDGEAATNVPPNRSWAAAANWVGDTVPADGAAIIFDHRTSGVTNLLDVSRTVTSLDLTYTASGSSSHTFDLNANTLTVTNSLSVGHERTAAAVAGSAVGRLRNGTLQLSNGASIAVACGSEFRVKSTGALVFDSTAVWRAGSLSDVLIGDSPISNQTENDGNLNLSALVNPDSLIWLNGALEVPGTLNIGKLHVGYDLEDRYSGMGTFSIGTALTQLVVRTELFVGVASAAVWTLPSSNVSYRLGDEQNGRADVRLNVAGGNRDAVSPNLLWSPSGGTFYAYLSSLQIGIGSSSDRAGGVWNATLSLTNTTVTAFDISGAVTIGGAGAINGTNGSGRGQGVLRLPATTARIGGGLVVDKGGSSALRSGLLGLHGTHLTVEGGVTVNSNGVVQCVCLGTSQRGDWFLRSPGDSVQAWQSYLTSGRMTSVNVPQGATFGVWSQAGYTHLGLLPPASTLVIIK